MPAGVAVMAERLGQSRGARKLRLLPAAGAGQARLADRAAVAQQPVEEAALAAKRRGPRVDRVDRGDQLLPAAVDGDDVAGLVEADVEHRLVVDSDAAHGDGLGVARHIVPVVGIELAGEAWPAERLGDRILVVDADLDRRGELPVDDRAAMLVNAGAAARQGSQQDRARYRKSSFDRR